MQNFLILTFVVLILGSSILYICKEKKKGVKCIGCPSGGCGADTVCSAGCADCSCSEK